MFRLFGWLKKKDEFTEVLWIRDLFKKAKKKKLVIHNVVNVLPWHATKKWRTRNVNKKVDMVVVHVGDTFASVGNINAYDIGPYNHICTTKPKGCPHFTYHFDITYPDGKVVQANRLKHITYHCKRRNLRSVGIMLEGKFICMKAGDYKNAFSHTDLMGESDVRKKYVDPTDAQLISLIQLLDKLFHDLPKYDYRTNLLGHCDVDPVNRCCDPGDTVYFLLQMYKRLRSKYST